MNKVDKFITDSKWIILILGLMVVYFFTDGDLKTKLVGFFIILFCGGMIVWALIALSNKKVRARIHWKSGEVTYTDYFERYSEYEEWYTAFYTTNKHLIYSIDEEEQQVSDRKV